MKQIEISFTILVKSNSIVEPNSTTYHFTNRSDEEIFDQWSKISKQINDVFYVNKRTKFHLVIRIIEKDELKEILKEGSNDPFFKKIEKIFYESWKKKKN